MRLTKNQIEAIRYQLKKQNITTSNDIIRQYAEKYDNFDAIAIANDIIKGLNQSSIIIQNNSESNNDDSMLSLLQSHESSTQLTTTQKSTLIQIKSQELGIKLSINDVQKISDMISDQINDSIDFLNQVSIIIKEFFDDRNNRVSDIVNEKINDIATIINAKNNELGDIFNGANKKLFDIASNCSQVKTDYKSTYRDNLESIREILKLSP